MKALSKFQKGVIILLLASITAGPLLLMPKKAEAVDIVFDPTNLVENAITAVQTAATAVSGAATQAFTGSLVTKEYILDTIATIAAKTILQQITIRTVNWIKTGDARGPSFVDNFLEHFTREMDNSVGLFLQQYFGKNSKLLGLLCEPFRLNLPPLLNAHRRGLSYTERARCKLSDIVRNVENFQVNVYFNDFSQGGWDAWFSMFEPEHNLIGQYLIGVDKIEHERAGAFLNSQTEVQTTGGGLLSWQECDEVPISVPNEDPDLGNVDETYKANCRTQTPGGIVSEQLKGVISSPIRQAELADEINESINVIFQALINQILSPTGGFARTNTTQLGQAAPLQPDTTPPVVTIPFPTDGSTIPTSAPLNITVSASDNTAVSGVSAFVNGVSIGPEDTSAPYSFVWNASQSPSGTYSISATARDPAGNIGSSTVRVSINSFTAPNISGTWLSGGSQNLPTSIQQFGNTVILTNEFGSASNGSFTSASVISATIWNATGTLNGSLNRIDWSNGTFWTR